MLISTIPIIEDNIVFVVAKDEQTNCWIIFDPQEGFGEEEYCVLEFGQCVSIVLNQFSINETDDLLILDAVIHNELSDKKDNRKMDKTIWDKHFTNIYDFLSELNLKSEKEKYDFYKKYKNILFYLQSGQQFSEYDTIPNNSSKEYIAEGYTMIGEKRLHIRYVFGWANMFIMDLEEVLFNPKVKIKFKLCTRCKKYFSTSTAHRLICEECDKNKETEINKQFETIKTLYNKIIKKTDLYIKAAKNEIELENRTKKIDSFKKNYAYYFDIVRYGESDKAPSDNFDESIKTPTDLINWLNSFYESICKNKKKEGCENGKTNEESERDGSDC